MTQVHRSRRRSKGQGPGVVRRRQRQQNRVVLERARELELHELQALARVLDALAAGPPLGARLVLVLQLALALARDHAAATAVRLEADELGKRAAAQAAQAVLQRVAP